MLILAAQSAPALPVEPWVIDAVVAIIGLLIAVAAVWLQWSHFKKTHPISQQGNRTRAPFGMNTPYNRWKSLYWREVRATFVLALISLFMVGFIVACRREVTVASIAAIVFWLGMFFYNLWVAQWYAWRIQNKRRR
ncbi:hypothetical protein M2103_001931 [Ereboglobus sp. PH5-5]|uniref:hypothetical protein n=1 Tax=Ereboglobus sp. PH5-10 TaxID=2940629 RepID=UPI0024053F29|nr:hypothetical protein [Ereboglobus sp. PH5-10]MDF9828334.1 hypothetical protein [Ereboglobus sp. PH5-10]MDF9833699.1 hypothetical protein [Ereboglobus sp. PH5-5]